MEKIAVFGSFPVYIRSNFRIITSDAAKVVVIDRDLTGRVCRYHAQAISASSKHDFPVRIFPFPP
jgi:hypothetical protein